MDSQAEAMVTVGDQLPWTTMTLDYTERLAEVVPDDLLDWRPGDPSGRFCFSLAEILMHIADARLMFIRQLIGGENGEGYWATGEGPNEEGVWTFRDHGGKGAILDSLKSTRGLVQEWLDKPVSELLAVTVAAREVFEKHLEFFRGTDRDTTDFERRGAPSVMRVMFALTTHEAGHRGALQTLLRLKGVNLEMEE